MRYLSTFLIFLLFTSITIAQEKEPEIIKKSVSFKPVNDATIINSDPMVTMNHFTGKEGKELRVGWNQMGEAMRAFLLFDISRVETPADMELTIDKAILTLYEANTNYHPFDGDDATRTVIVHQIQNDQLDSANFSSTASHNCGTIAKWGYNVLEDYSVSIKSAVASCFKNENKPCKNIQLRIQLSNDHNIDNMDESVLDGSWWSFFSIDEKNSFTPTLYVEYTLKEIIDK